MKRFNGKSKMVGNRATETSWLDLNETAERASRGDEEAFALLYEQYLTPIYRYIYFRVRHKETAEDLTQTVFLKAWNKIGDFKVDGGEKGEGGAILSWLYTIARNLTIDHWKKKHDVITSEQDVLFDSIVDERLGTKRVIRQTELRREILKALGELSSEQQDVVIHRHIEGRSYEEISRFTNKREEALRALNHRATKALKEKLGEIKKED